jgi:hypothetical protein
MDRVWGLNASSTVPTKPSTLEIGYPRSSGVATTPGYWWYYMVTETLRHPIVNAGLTPSADALDQLTQAITIIAQRNNVSGSVGPVRLVDTVGVPLSGTQTVDGIIAVTGARILRAVGNDINNGVWIANQAGAWTRADDWAVGDVIIDGTLVEVAGGNTHANTLYMFDGNSSYQNTVGTTGGSFVEITAGIKAALASYLTTATAASTYLTQANASSTYALKSEIAGFISASDVAATYLTKSSASATYATASSLSAYLTSSSASSTYLTKTTAASTYALQSSLSSYLTTVGAASTYFSLAGATNAIRAGEGVNELVVASGRVPSDSHPEYLRLAIYDLVYPLNHVITRYDTINPSTLYQGTTWTQIAQGRMLVGWNSADTDFDPVASTGGSKTKVLTVDNIPPLPYRDRYYTESGPYAEVTHWETYPYAGYNGSLGSGGSDHDNDGFLYVDAQTSNDPAIAFNMMNPYLVVAIWRRTA